MYHVPVSNIFEILGEEGEDRSKKQVPAKETAPTKKATPPTKETAKKETAPPTKGTGAPRVDRGDRKPRPEGKAPRLDSAKIGEDRASRPPRQNRGTDRPKGPRGDKPEGGAPSRKRTFDRKSGTGRGKEIKRGGGGKGNWGKEGDPVEENPQEEGESTTEAAAEAKTDATPAVPAEPVEPKELTEEEKKWKEEREKEEKQITLTEFMKLKESSSKNLPKLPAPRSVEGKPEWDSYTLLKKDTEETKAATEAEEKEEKKKDPSKKQVISVADVLHIQSKPIKEDRGDRPPRGGPRGKGPKIGAGGPKPQTKKKVPGGAAPNVKDQASFPALSQATKA